VKNPAQIEDNVGALGWSLSEADTAYLEGAEVDCAAQQIN